MRMFSAFKCYVEVKLTLIEHPVLKKHFESMVTIFWSTNVGKMVILARFIPSKK